MVDVLPSGCDSFCQLRLLENVGLFRKGLFVQWYLGQKKVVLFLEIGQVKIFYHSPSCIVECISEYILISKNKQKKEKKLKKKKRDYLRKIDKDFLVIRISGNKICFFSST